MLGPLIYEHKGKVSGYRVLDTDGPTLEITITGSGITNGIEVNDVVTYWTKPSSKDNEKIHYAEGQRIVIAKDGTESATWKGYGIGRYTGNKRSDVGSVFIKTFSSGKLAFLNNMVGVFEYEADENGNTGGKIWEWK